MAAVLCNRTRKGFTLIEIIMVMVIIGLLAAILVPNFFSFREDANKESVKSTLITLSDVSEMYFIKEGQYPADMNVLTSSGEKRLDKDPCGNPGGRLLL